MFWWVYGFFCSSIEKYVAGAIVAKSDRTLMLKSFGDFFVVFIGSFGIGSGMGCLTALVRILLIRRKWIVLICFRWQNLLIFEIFHCWKQRCLFWCHIVLFWLQKRRDWQVIKMIRKFSGDKNSFNLMKRIFN